VPIQLSSLSATEAIAHFEARTFSPVELVRAVIERAEKAESVINAFTETFFEWALEQAQEAEGRYARGEALPLEGVPLAIKDEAAIEGQRTTNGSLLRRDHVDATTSPCIERLLDAGAIAHARTTCPEFCCTTVTHSRLGGGDTQPVEPRVYARRVVRRLCRCAGRGHHDPRDGLGHRRLDPDSGGVLQCRRFQAPIRPRAPGPALQPRFLLSRRRARA
jgi:hypothetical protein